MALPTLRPGKVRCLRCGKKFKSRDVSTNRICMPCKRLIDREYIPRVLPSTVYPSDGTGVCSRDFEN